MAAQATHPTASVAIHLVPICFEFTHPTARTVFLAGTFNHWKPEGKTMHSSSTGRWWKDMALAPGTYEYCLIVDGRWMPDPMARETVPNPFGGRNSVLQVASSPEAGHLADAENLPFSQDEVSRRAYFSYVNEGELPGRDEQHWLKAEADLLAEGALTRVHGFRNKTQ